jgi:hypothetical protein
MAYRAPPAPITRGSGSRRSQPCRRQPGVRRARGLERRAASQRLRRDPARSIASSGACQVVDLAGAVLRESRAPPPRFELAPSLSPSPYMPAAASGISRARRTITYVSCAFKVCLLSYGWSTALSSASPPFILSRSRSRMSAVESIVCVLSIWRRLSPRRSRASPSAARLARPHRVDELPARLVEVAEISQVVHNLDDELDAARARLHEKRTPRARPMRSRPSRGQEPTGHRPYSPEARVMRRAACARSGCLPISRFGAFSRSCCCRRYHVGRGRRSRCYRGERSERRMSWLRGEARRGWVVGLCLAAALSFAWTISGGREQRLAPGQLRTIGRLP